MSSRERTNETLDKISESLTIVRATGGSVSELCTIIENLVSFIREHKHQYTDPEDKPRHHTSTSYLETESAIV